MTTPAHGFTLVETLLATSMMVIAVLSASALIVVSSRVNRSASLTTMTELLAIQKVEQLRGLAWGFDGNGLPLSDMASDITVVPEGAVSGTGLRRSPPQSLLQNTYGYCDFLDARGQSLGGGVAPPAGATFVRRWSIEPLQASGDALVLQVLVSSSRSRGAADTDAAERAGRRFPDEARIVTVKTRKAQ